MSTFYLVRPDIKERAIKAIREAPDDYVAKIEQRKRTDAQNRHFHWLCGLAAKAKIEWMGKPRTAKEWKILFISGHAIATGEGAEVIGGLEGEMVNIRESSALMSKRRGASLVEYTMASLIDRGVEIPAFEDV